MSPLAGQKTGNASPTDAAHAKNSATEHLSIAFDIDAFHMEQVLIEQNLAVLNMAR